MDMETKRDMESIAEWAATQDAWDRLLERRNRPLRRHLHFWLNVRQVVYEPTVAVATPGAADPTSAPTLGVATGAAGSQSRAPRSPQFTVPGSRLPGRPHHL
jgi:hypothetical protein